MTVAIRRMTEADLAAVLAIATASPEAPRWQRSDYGLFVDVAERPNANLLRAGLVAGASAEVLGFACVSLLRDREENRAELDSLAVAPAARGQGIGAALVAGVLAWCAGEGARRLHLEVRASNRAALGLYRRLGFCAEGRRPGYYADPAEDALLLGMDVTLASPSGSFSTENAVEGGSSRC